MRRAVQMQITTIGLDIAKNVFQVHGIDAKEKVVARKQLRRSRVITFFKALPPGIIGIEACHTAHYWARAPARLGRSPGWGNGAAYGLGKTSALAVSTLSR